MFLGTCTKKMKSTAPLPYSSLPECLACKGGGFTAFAASLKSSEKAPFDLDKH
jgi:hypothetical protein